MSRISSIQSSLEHKIHKVANNVSSDINKHWYRTIHIECVLWNECNVQLAFYSLLNSSSVLSTGWLWYRVAVARKVAQPWYLSVENKVTLIDLGGLLYPFISD